MKKLHDQMNRKISIRCKDLLIYFIKIIVSFCILSICFKIVDWNNFKAALVGGQLTFYFYAICVTVVASIVMPALVTWTAQRTGRLSFSLIELITINFSIRLYTILLPRAIATGMRWLKYKKGNTGNDAFVIIIFEKVSQMAIMMSFASLFLLLEIENKNLDEGLTPLFIFTLIANLLCLIIFSAFFYRNLALKLQFVTRKFDIITPPFIRKQIDSLWESVSAFQKLEYKDIIACFVYSSISYILYIVAPYIIAMSMDIEISIYALAWMRAIIMLLALAPVTVAGLGVREVGFIAFLQMYSVPRSTAFAFSLLIFFQHIFIGFIGLIIETWLYILKPLIRQRDKSFFQKGN